MNNVLHFGRFKGLPITDVPRYYLRWVSANCENISPALKRAIDDILVEKKPAPQWDGVIEQLSLDLRNSYGTDLGSMAVVNDCLKRLRSLTFKQ